jgi:hypothetical protein
LIDVVGEGTNGSALRTYGQWVGQNRPDVAGDLVNEFTAEWKLTPDTVERRRELVADGGAAVGAGVGESVPANSP